MYGKMSENGVFSGPYFPGWELNNKIYFANHRIQSKYSKVP